MNKASIYKFLKRKNARQVLEGANGKVLSHSKDWEQLKIASCRGSTIRIGQHDPESQVFFTVNRNGTQGVRDDPRRRKSRYPPQTTFQSDYSPESFQIY